jgi:hypothetical protein
MRTRTPPPIDADLSTRHAGPGTARLDAGACSAALTRDGIVGLPQLMTAEWAARVLAEYQPVLRSGTGADGWVADRGRHRFYQAVHADWIPSLMSLLLNPLLDELLTLQLGPDYQLVELAFDTALPGASAQPLHGDFPESNPGVIEALAVNFTTRVVTPECAPFAYAPGTHRDVDRSRFAEGRCVPADELDRYAGAIRQSLPVPGDVSVRSPLMLHGGTEHRATGDRTVGIVGFVAAHVPSSPDIGVVMTDRWFDRFPVAYRRHLTRCRIVGGDALPDHAVSRPLNCIAAC